MQSKIKAVLFDLDGVLIDATEWHYEALNKALNLFGYGVPRYEHVSRYNGLPTSKKLEMLSLEDGLPRALHSLISKLKQVHTQEEVRAKCWPTFEKEYLLSRLKREGYRLAVCSNAILESVELMLGRADLIKYLEFVLSNEDVPKPKPDPAIYVKAIARLGVTPAETVIVEDAPHGIQAARASGAHVCVVAGFAEVEYPRVRDFIDQVERKAAR